MKKVLVCLVVIAIMAALPLEKSFAARRKTSADLLREGLLGAGAGAVGGAAAGAKGRDIWKGALAGAGISIIGGALLDSMSGQKVDDVEYVDSVSPRTAFSDGYESGYANGYKKGFMDGYKEGLKEAVQGY